MVLQPYREYRRKLQEYKQAFVEAMQREYTLHDYTRNELKNFQRMLSLRDEDVASIEAKISSGREFSSTNQDAPSTEPVRLEPKDVTLGNETISAVKSTHPTTQPVFIESITNNLSSEQMRSPIFNL